MTNLATGFIGRHFCTKIAVTGPRTSSPPLATEHLDTFWELIDEILNAALFVLIGLEILLIRFDAAYGWAAALAIPVVLASRFLSVGVAALMPWLRRDFPPYVIGMLTWGGLRGGVLSSSVASATGH